MSSRRDGEMSLEEGGGGEGDDGGDRRRGGLRFWFLESLF